MSESASSGAAKRRSRMPVRVDDPLVGGVDELGHVVVRDHALGDVHAETRDRDRARRSPSPITASAVANVRVPRTASSSPTRATALPRPTGPRTASSSQVSVSSSPGSTIRLKRTSSIPAKSASLPRFSSSESAAIAPAWASASTMITPGMIGRPGKCPGKNHSSPVTSLRATTRTPGSSSSTSSRKRKGSRCGMIVSITSRPNGACGGMCPASLGNVSGSTANAAACRVRPNGPSTRTAA